MLSNSLAIFLYSCTVILYHLPTSSRLSRESYWESQKPEKLNGLLQQEAAAPVLPTGFFLFSPFLKLWGRLSLLLFSGLFIEFRLSDLALKIVLPQFHYNFTVQSVLAHHDSKWFSNEIIKQQHCLFTTANIWYLHLLSRFYGKSYSFQ